MNGRNATQSNPSSNPNPSANGQARGGKPPTHSAYQVRELPNRKDKKAIWTRIGSAWPHSDGEGFNIQIDCVPLDGRIVLRVISDKRD